MAALIERLITMLKAENISFDLIRHRRDFTAQEAAADTHTPGRKFAKTVLLWIDGGYAMAVLPAHEAVDMSALRRALAAKEIKLATEAEISELCPDCEVGAVPPFGNLYNLPVYVDMEVSNEEQITFNAGTHIDAIRMRYADFVQLARPKEIFFTKEAMS